MSLSEGKNRHYAENIVKIVNKDSLASVYIFMSKKGNDYIMSLKSCSCKSFLFNSVFKQVDDSCYHLKYLKTAQEEDRVMTIYLNNDDFLLVIEEIFSIGKSLKLRKSLLNGKA